MGVFRVLHSIKIRAKSPKDERTARVEGWGDGGGWMTRTLSSRQPDAGGRLRAYRARPIWGERNGMDTIARMEQGRHPRRFMECGMFIDDNAISPLSMLAIIYSRIVVPQA